LLQISYIFIIRDALSSPEAEWSSSRVYIPVLTFDKCEVPSSNLGWATNQNERNKMTKSSFPMPGSKQRLASKIIDYFPKDYDVYCEVFAGTFSVGLACDHHLTNNVREVLNDHNNCLLNFMDVARRRTDELVEQLSLVPYSRTLLNTWREEWIKTDFKELDELEKAVRWWYCTKSAFSGWLSPDNKGWQHMSHPSGTTTWHPRTFRNAIKKSIPAFAKRMELVQLECRDWETFIKKYDDGPGVLMYLDPPYLDSKFYEEGENKYYGNAWTYEDEERLAEVVNNCTSNIIISNYTHSRMPKLFPDWRVVSFPRTRVTSVNSKHNGMKFAEEILLMNYA